MRAGGERENNGVEEGAGEEWVGGSGGEGGGGGPDSEMHQSRWASGELSE